MHPRQEAGGRATDPNDYPAGKSIYALRNVDALKKKALERGAHVGEYAERLLGGPLPWTQMRAAYALISLCEKYGDGAVESVCQTRARTLDCVGRQTHLAHCSSLVSVARRRRAETTSCSFDCPSRARASSAATITSARERSRDEHRDFSPEPRLGASTPASRSHDRHAA